MNSSRCAACKHLRQRCPADCVFSPYFPSHDPGHRFAYVHRIYGASNVKKILKGLAANYRAQAMDSMYFEAYCRIKNPIYGCVGMISVLYQEINNVESDLARVRAEISMAQNMQLQNEPKVYEHGQIVADNLLGVGSSSTTFYDTFSYLI